MSLKGRDKEMSKSAKMTSETLTEALVRNGMHFELGDNNFGKVYPQSDASKISSALGELLCKAGGKPKSCELSDFSKGGNGKAKPEFVITLKNYPETIIVIECKSSTKKHASKNLDKPDDYAVDGVLYYAKFLKDGFNVIAVAVSGTEKNDYKVNAYVWRKGQNSYVELEAARDGFYSPLDYIKLANGEKAKREFSLENIRTLALTMHDALRSVGMTEKDKPIFIAGILIALNNDGFAQAYKASPNFDTTIDLLQSALKKELGANKVKQDKVEDIQAKFAAISRNPKLKKIDLIEDGSIRWYIDELANKIKPMMENAESTLDALSVFYHEFVKYSGGDGSGLGIVLTPQHLTEFMYIVSGANKSSKILDICWGSGSFLVTAMSHMFSKATDAEKKVIKESLYGIEINDDLYTLAIANMIVRGDGRSNIEHGDSFELAKRWNGKCNIGLINPPYSQKDHSELEFIELMLNTLSVGGIGVAVVPMSCAIGTKFKEVRERLFKKHSLKAVFSMPDDIFYPVGTNVCVMVWEAHRAHNDNPKPTFFGYYKDDGLVKAKKQGRVDKFGRWKAIEKEWLKHYDNLDVIDGLTAKCIVDWDDEWLAEAYMETDYSKLSQSDFQDSVNNYLAYLVKSGN